jgi:hypothetical protein
LAITAHSPPPGGAWWTVFAEMNARHEPRIEPMTPLIVARQCLSMSIWLDRIVVRYPRNRPSGAMPTLATMATTP